MAVYTEVSFDEAAALVRTLGIGELRDLHGCAGGIENTNYFADTSGGRFVLTLFERLQRDELPFYLLLMKHLAEHGIPVPLPRADRSGNILHALAGKPVAVVDRLEGAHHLAPDKADCTSLGAMLARMHIAAADFPLRQPNLRGLAWWNETVPVIAPFVTESRLDLLQQELAFQNATALLPAHAALPRSAIHADLFRDNAMFVGSTLTGIFDFYFAGVDSQLFDIAVALNDWCIDLATGVIDAARARSLVDAYDAVRPLTRDERQLLPATLRGAALRFWISRLWDLHLPRDAAVLTAHDPTHFERVLRERVAVPWRP